jgi:hypothetical protein
MNTAHSSARNPDIHLDDVKYAFAAPAITDALPAPLRPPPPPTLNPGGISRGVFYFVRLVVFTSITVLLDAFKNVTPDEASVTIFVAVLFLLAACVGAARWARCRNIGLDTPWIIQIVLFSTVIAPILTLSLNGISVCERIITVVVDGALTILPPNYAKTRQLDRAAWGWTLLLLVSLLAAVAMLFSKPESARTPKSLPAPAPVSPTPAPALPALAPTPAPVLPSLNQIPPTRVKPVSDKEIIVLPGGQAYSGGKEIPKAKKAKR